MTRSGFYRADTSLLTVQATCPALHQAALKPMAHVLKSHDLGTPHCVAYNYF